MSLEYMVRNAKAVLSVLAIIALVLHFASHHVSILFPNKPEAWKDETFFLLEQYRAVFMYAAWYFVGVALNSRLLKIYGSFAVSIAILALIDELTGVGTMFSWFEEFSILFSLVISIYEYKKSK